MISPLAAQATARAGAMVQAEPAAPRRRIPLSARAADAPGAPLVVPGWQPPGPAASADERLAALQQRRRLADHCRDCPIGAQATQTVHGEGPLGAWLMVLGEQPGDVDVPEDTATLLGDDPFTGWETAADGSLAAFAEDVSLLRKMLET